MIEDSPNNVWQISHKYSGISKEYFDAYFNGCDEANAIMIGEVVKRDTPIDPKKVIPNFHAPQNYMYMDFYL